MHGVIRGIPGYSIQSGWYTLVVEDAQKTTSDRVEFSVVGGGRFLFHRTVIQLSGEIP